VTPSPRRDHQFIIFRLADDIYEAACGRYRVAIDADLRLRDVPLLVRRPDIVAFDATLPSDAVLRPEHCALVVEIMSPGSVTTDQTDKPAEYSAAGIKHFWRIEDISEEKQTLKIFRYRLDPTTRTYTSAGVDSDTLSVREPISLAIDLADLF
jgi:Uma2 family endonuclease